MSITQTWGRRIPENLIAQIAVTWGARAIFTHQQIDLLPDRQSWSLADFSEDDADETSTCYWDRKETMKPLMQWVNKIGLPFLRKEAKRLYGDENRTIDLTEGKFHIEANPQASYGYLYIRAWETKP